MPKPSPYLRYLVKWTDPESGVTLGECQVANLRKAKELADKHKGFVLDLMNPRGTAGGFSLVYDARPH